MRSDAGLAPRSYCWRRSILVKVRDGGGERWLWVRVMVVAVVVVVVLVVVAVLAQGIGGMQ